MLPWNTFGNIKEDTGFTADTLDYIFFKYCGIGTQITKPELLYKVYLLHKNCKIKSF